MWSTVELREIRVFLALADELHFARTAERLGLTPSRVSQTIRDLETRVGGDLFAGTSRSVKPTPLGASLLRGMGPAYERMERGSEKFARLRRASPESRGSGVTTRSTTVATSSRSSNSSRSAIPPVG